MEKEIATNAAHLLVNLAHNKVIYEVYMTTLSEYKKAKQKRDMSTVPGRDYCLTCLWPKEHCMCKYIKPFHSDIKFVILIHPKEAKQEKSGTGRLTVASIINSDLIMGINFTDNKTVNDYLQDERYFPAVLYPGTNSINVSQGEFGKEMLGGKQLLVFLIDGTWSCAKKMMKESKNLHSIPWISFSSTKRSEFAIKQQPHELCLSTLESVHFLIDEWHRIHNIADHSHDTLLEVFREMISFQINCANDPDNPKEVYNRFPNGTPHMKHKKSLFFKKTNE